PALLGPNPSLLTVIERDGIAVKAYAEDASRGVYEELVRLEVPEGAGVEDFLRAASEAGIEIGVVKRADVTFFEAFAEEPTDLVDALALFVSGVAAALREGRMVLSPEPGAAALLRKIALDRDTLRLMLSRLLPDGAYGVAVACARGTAALVLEVAGERWSVREVDAASLSPGAAAHELVDGHGCAAAVGLSLPDVRRLIIGQLGLADLLRRRGESWGIATCAGVEGLLAAAGPLSRFLGLEEELAECNVDLESVLALLGDYRDAARGYALSTGVGVRVTDGAKSIALLWDREGLREAERPDPIELDWSLVRRALGALASDPLGQLGELVPRGVVDDAGYETVVALLECSEPRGRLVLFGGPHRFFNAAWEGDACAVFIDARGRAEVVELPSRPLEVADEGGRLRLEHERCGFDLVFRPVRTNRRVHGAGRYFAGTAAAGWLPGLDVERGLCRFRSGRARVGDDVLAVESGWMLLERGGGRLLRWPFGATWHYASWLFPDGASGAGVLAAPMLGDSTPHWLRKFMSAAVDGAVAISPAAGGPVDFAPAVQPGDRVRVVRDSASAGALELRYEVLFAPFDEEGQAIFRLRCLCNGGAGAGLVEVPATLPAHFPRAEECAVSFTPETISFHAGGRELLLVERGGSRFLSPYAPPAPGILRRAARRLLGSARSS
ncbi:MAG: hypothetical protein ACYS9X_32725, partial [Planctomycetota bacterium]